MDNNEKPLVTFALFAYNQEDYIREAIEGAFSQTYEPLEIILSDDCSTDRTFEIMQEMAAAYEGPHKFHINRNVVNLGLADHINYILSQSSGEFICWAAGDDISMPKRVNTLIGPMLNDSSVMGTHSTVQEMDVSGELGKIRRHSSTITKLSVNKVVSSGDGVVSQTHAFRRLVFDIFGVLNKDLSNEGPAMAFRECLLGKVVYIDKPTVYYRVGSGVSTYQGGNILREKIHEPIKVSKWRLTAYKQMLSDAKCERVYVDEKFLKTIELKVSFYKNLMDINTGRAIFSCLVKNLFLAPKDTASLRASIRVLMPELVYRMLK